jgi:hypothetical protein
MPRSSRTSALALLGLLPMFVPGAARAGETSAAAANRLAGAPLATEAKSIALSTYVGPLHVDGKDGFSAGIEAVYAHDWLRVGGFGEIGGTLFGATHHTLGASVGGGWTAAHGHVDGRLGVEGGAEMISGIGAGLLGDSRDIYGAASLPFAGVRASLTLRLGTSRIFGLGLLAFARTDLGRATAAAVRYPWLCSGSCSPTVTQYSVGGSSGGGALAVSAAF